MRLFLQLSGAIKSRGSQRIFGVTFDELLYALIARLGLSSFSAVWPI